MVHLTVPLEHFMAGGHEAVKTLRGTTEWYLQRSLTGMNEAVRALLGHWYSDDFQRLLQECASVGHAIRVCPWDAGDEEAAHSQLWQFLINLCSELALTGLQFQGPPWSMLALASPHLGVVNEALARHSLQWKAYTCLEKKAQEDAMASEWLGALVVPRQQWVMENFVRLWEHDFKIVPASLLKALQEFSRSWMSSLVIEHLWNAARRGASHTGTGRMGHDSLFHHIALASNTLTEFGRIPCEIQPEARMAAPSKLPADAYLRQPARCSLDEEDVTHMQSNAPDWPTASGASMKKSFVAWEAMTVVQGNWERLQHGWKSLLTRPGMLINRQETGQLLLVLGSTAYGFLGWRVGCRTSTRELFFPKSAQVEVHVVDDLSVWNATECEIKRYTADKSEKRFVGPVITRKGHTLLKWAARGGFEGLTLYYLKKLAAELDVKAADVNKPLTIDNWVIALVTKTLGEQATESVVKDALLRRNGLNAKSQNPLSAERAAEDLQEAGESDTNFEDEDVQLQDLRFEAQAAAALERRQNERRRNIEAAFAVAARPAESAGRASRQRVFVPVVSGGISAEMAKAYAPPHVRLYKDISRENRWRMYSPVIGRERTKSFGRRSQLDDWGAMTHLLLLAWQSHFQSTGEECPWEFQRLRDGMLSEGQSVTAAQ